MGRLTMKNSDGTYSQPTHTTFEKMFYKLAEFEDFMEEMGFKSLNDLKKVLGKQFEIKQEPRHLGRKINDVYFTNEQIYILNQFSEFNTSYLNKYKVLWNRWNELNQWAIKERGYSSIHQEERYQAFDEFLDKMQELESKHE